VGNNKGKVIALFDFDITAFRASAAIEKRSVEVLHKATGRTKVFKTRTAFKDFLKEKDWEYNADDYEFNDIQTPEPAVHAFQITKTQINAIRLAVGAKEIEGYVGEGDSNFRLNLELPEKYKGSRDNMMRPLHLKATKKYLLDNYPGSLVKKIEVDDYLVIRSHELEREGHYPVIITIDKDSKGCVGTRYYDWTQDEPEILEVPAFGYLEYDEPKKKVQGLGLNFYCYQMLQGDTADDYTPRDLHGTNLGDKKAVELLQACSTVDELFTTVENQYKKWFPEPVTYNTWDGKEVTKDYKQILELYHSLVYMQRKLNDDTTFYSLWEEFK
jgi:hypothetical protein